MFGFDKKKSGEKIGNGSLQTRESQLYAEAFGSFVKTPIMHDSDEPKDELSSETGANIAGALGLCQPFGSYQSKLN